VATGQKRPSEPSSDNARRAAMRTALRGLTQRFVSDVMSLFQDALLLEASAAASAEQNEPQRRARRDVHRLDAISEDVVRALAGGVAMSVSQLAAAVGAVPRELAHPIARLVRAGRLEQHGERKGTRYTCVEPKRGAKPKRSASAKRGAQSKRPATAAKSRARKR